MNTPHQTSLRAALVAATLTIAAPAFAAIALAPQYAGATVAGGGVNAQFAQINSDWRGSTVLWDEPSKTYGVGQPIAGYGWGTGLWGRADFDAVASALTEPGASGAPTIINSWSGVVPTINYANTAYNSLYSSRWGPAELVPFFDDTMPAQAQENWISRFSGFLRVTEPGDYSFGVLNDDGFFFRLIGADGAVLETGRDFLNPRERSGFDEDVTLSAGLYGIELGMWNRLEAGVVDLRWSLDGGTTWDLIPTGNLGSQPLLPPTAIPAPGTLALLALPLLALVRRPRHA